MGHVVVSQSFLVSFFVFHISIIFFQYSVIFHLLIVS